MARRSYSGNAKATTLSGGISAAATSITVADATGYPTGANGPFVVTVAAGSAAEEKMLIASRTGNTLSVSARGWDGTTASDHDNAVSLSHTYSAVDADEANAHVNSTDGSPHDITFTSDGTTAPGSFPQGVSTSSWAAAASGQPDTTSSFTVLTVRQSSITMFQVAAGRDNTPEGDEPMYFRVGYSGGTPEWGPWQKFTMTLV